MSNHIDEMIKEQKRRSQEASQGKDSDFWRIFEYFLSKDGIRGKTVLTEAQRNMIYVYDLMHQKHPRWGLEKAAENLAVLFISDKGKSRTQSIELFRGLLSQMRQESLMLDTTGKNNSGPTPPMKP